MVSLAIFGGNTLDGSAVDPGERVIGLALFGGIAIDFSTVPPPPAVDLLLVTLFGGVSVKVRPEQDVRMRGFSVFGGRHVAPRRLPPPAAVPAPVAADDDDLPLEIAAFALFGGVSVERQAPRAV